jgi:hypothetical protein
LSGKLNGKGGFIHGAVKNARNTTKRLKSFMFSQSRILVADGDRYLSKSFRGIVMYVGRLL